MLTDSRNSAKGFEAQYSGEYCHYYCLSATYQPKIDSFYSKLLDVQKNNKISLLYRLSNHRNNQDFPLSPQNNYYTPEIWLCIKFNHLIEHRIY